MGVGFVLRRVAQQFFRDSMHKPTMREKNNTIRMRRDRRRQSQVGSLARAWKRPENQHSPVPTTIETTKPGVKVLVSRFTRLDDQFTSFIEIGAIAARDDPVQWV